MAVVCVVCANPITRPGASLCFVCQQSYDRMRERGGTIMDIIEWAADRARASVKTKRTGR